MFDIDACAIALDVTTPESLCTIAGTWSINEYIRRDPVLDGTIAMNSLYAIPGYYLIEECCATSCGNLEWYLRNLMPRREGGGSLYELCNREVASVTPEETDLYFLLFLYGSNAHPLGKAAFVGMTEYHREPHMLRAVYEGVAYSHRTHIDRLLKSRPLGGPHGGRSGKFAGLGADVRGHPEPPRGVFPRPGARRSGQRHRRFGSGRRL